MTDTITAAQITRIDRYIRELDRDIDGQLRAQRATIGHALALLAQAAHPGVVAVWVYGIDEDGYPSHIRCRFHDRPEEMPLTADYSGLEDSLVAMLRRLPDGDSGIWSRRGNNAALAVAAALESTYTYPLRAVGERIIEDLEKAAGGRSIRTATITTEEFDNGFHPTDYIDVDFSDGDSDEIFLEDFADYTGELSTLVGGFGRSTTLTITSTATGVTIT